MICEAVSSFLFKRVKVMILGKDSSWCCLLILRMAYFVCVCAQKKSSKCFTAVEYDVECVKRHLFGVADITEHLINSDGVKER